LSRLDQYRGKSLYLDTNVLIYAAEGFSAYRVILVDLLSRLEVREIGGVTSEIALMEVLVRPLRDQNQRMVSFYEEFLGSNSLLRMVPIDRAILQGAAEIRAAHLLKPIDAIHVATAQLSKCDALVSEDRRLRSAQIPTITVSELDR
jgi:predicted nucleic acid-binding protein